MVAKLSKELSAALQAQQADRLEVVDPQDNRVYYLIDADTLNLLEAKGDHAAIAAGIADMEAGRGMSTADAEVHLRRRLGFPPRQA